MTSTTFFARGGRLAVFLGDVTGGNRSGRRHGDGEVQLPRARPQVARTRRRSSRTPTKSSSTRSASSSRCSTCSSILERKIACASAGHPAPRIISPGGKVSRSTPEALRWGSSRTRSTRPRKSSSRPVPPSSCTRTASSRRAATASCTARSDSTRRSQAPQARCTGARGGDPRRLPQTRKASSMDDCAIVCLKLAATES